MDKKRMGYFTMGFVVLLLVVVLLLARGGLHETVGIVLPSGQTDSDSPGEKGPPSSINVVAITPDTVQPAINTLSRPAAYSRTQTVETYWSGGSGKSISQIHVSGGRARIDTQLPDGGVRHELVVGGTAAVWYDEEKTWTVLTAQEFTADIAQRMLTYEQVRDLPVADIAEANYCQLDGESYIYVATRRDEDGYVQRYWVNVATGLLQFAERTYQGDVIYRFEAKAPAAEVPMEYVFLLPDGTALKPEA